MLRALKRQQGPVYLLAILVLGLNTGCASVRIARPDNWDPATQPKTRWVAPNDAYTVSSAATAPERTTVWVFGWGGIPPTGQKNIDPCNCRGNWLAEVRVSTNIGFELISVLSLGMAQPFTVEWRCAKLPQPASAGF
jgi:hypothetical protein